MSSTPKVISRAAHRQRMAERRARQHARQSRWVAPGRKQHSHHGENARRVRQMLRLAAKERLERGGPHLATAEPELSDA